MSRTFASTVVGFDDFPFPRSFRGDVRIIGAVYMGLRLDGIISGCIRKDGANSTDKLTLLVQGSKFASQIKLVMLQGIALGGFNVVDIHNLHQRLGLPVLVVARRAPDLRAIKEALLTRVQGGARKWRLIERAGEMEPIAGVYVQRAGLTPREAGQVIERYTACGRIPEPLRVAHLIAGGVGDGQSRGRA
ncbi:MAG TPA: DUF99 family protein [Pyrinomonadaceae bacterium]|nr:DUF99 family protein [Pyrinomonadaceae bacterium]